LGKATKFIRERASLFFSVLVELEEVVVLEGATRFMAEDGVGK
jgi:hypothetical protein